VRAWAAPTRRCCAAGCPRNEVAGAPSSEGGTGQAGRRQIGRRAPAIG
jgi:hypothetical protein